MPPNDISVENDNLITKLRREVDALKNEVDANTKIATTATKELSIIKKQLKQINTRMIANENDIRHIGSKR